MPSSSIIIPFRNLLSVLLLLPLVLSCRQDELILPVPPVSGKGETAEVTLSVRIPDFRAESVTSLVAPLPGADGRRDSSCRQLTAKNKSNKLPVR